MATAELSTNSGPKTIKQILQGESFKNQIAMVLPKHCSPDRMARIAIAALTRTPKLAQCTQESFFKCMMDLSQWGLEPDGRRAHLIPYGNACTLVIDYKGLAELCYRSGVVSVLHADVVRRGDLFDYSMGEVRVHVPHYLRNDSGRPDAAGDVYAVYCIARMKDGSSKAEAMSVDDVKSIRARSKSGNNGPWVTDWNEMAKKTVFRRLSKWLPLSAEVRDAVERDQENDMPAIAQLPPGLANGTQTKLEALTEELGGDLPAEIHDVNEPPSEFEMYAGEILANVGSQLEIEPARAMLEKSAKSPADKAMLKRMVEQRAKEV